MVIGLKAKNHRGPTVQIDYLVQLLEIKPWLLSQSPKSLRSVLIQWENGERSSGMTNAVVPSIGGEGRIEFNESFKLPVTLLRDVAVKGGKGGAEGGDAFLKNSLELNLYEPRRDKTAKGQLLATAVVDLADVGVVRECVSVSAPMNSKRSIKNTDMPILYMKIQPFKKGRSSASSKDSLSRGVSLEKAGGESVSALMDEEYADEAEASFTDDDVSSQSSQTVSYILETPRRVSSAKQETGQANMPHINEGNNTKHSVASNIGTEKSRSIPLSAPQEYLKGSSSCSSSVDLSSDPGSPINGHASVAYSRSSSSTTVSKTGGSLIVSSSSSSLNENAEESNISMQSNDHAHADKLNDKVNNGKAEATADVQESSIDDEKAQEINRNFIEVAADDDKQENRDKNGTIQEENSDKRQQSDEENHSEEGGPYVAVRANGKDVPLGTNENIMSNEKLKPIKSVRSIADLSKNISSSSDQHVEVKDGVQEDAQKSAGVSGNRITKERKDAKVYPKDTRSVILESKVNQLEHKIKMLEGELREAAAVESALYSVVAEHGSSMSKVHAPARRLSRLYLHACGESSRSRRASAARSVVSGLVLVAKACGNDVSRLTFWLSNSIVLRTIISQASGDPAIPKSGWSLSDRNGTEKVKQKALSPLKWEAPSSGKKQGMRLLNENFGDWENPNTIISTLEKVESWIFSRIVESIWWQTLTPHMQSITAKATDDNIGSESRYRRTSSSVDQELVDACDFSLNLWKKAFKDACERLCPLRAGGHECGCLPLLSRLVMEQSVARLDVALFNAILRESSDEIPSDPVSDPISDLKVLPIPAGKSSFGAGAQLKTVIGNWSRWLTDLFGIDDDDSFEDLNGNDDDDNDGRHDTSFKSFHLLNALSDLMMLPKDMLLSKTVRKEVCPAFAAPLIRRILDNFVPDEFCTDPIPVVVLENLEYEDTRDIGEESLRNIPCSGPGTVYLPPSTDLVAGIIGNGGGGQSQLRRSGSSVVRKSYTSDDELDELNSPLASIFIGSSGSSPVASKLNWVPKGNMNQNAVRYELLRDVWMNSEN